MMSWSEVRCLWGPIQCKSAVAMNDVSRQDPTSDPRRCNGRRWCAAFDEARGLLARGLASRATAFTNMNDASSRSHAIVTLKVKAYSVPNRRAAAAAEGGEDGDAAAEDGEGAGGSGGGGEGIERTSKVSLVDLAGSEVRWRDMARWHAWKNGRSSLISPL